MKGASTIAQVITVQFKNGKIGKFVGPAVIDAKDGLVGRIGIEKVAISPPLKMEAGSFFAENRDGVMFLMKEETVPTETVEDDPGIS